MDAAACLSTVVLTGLLSLWAILESSHASDTGDVEIYEDMDGNLVIHKLEDK